MVRAKPGSVDSRKALSNRPQRAVYLAAIDPRRYILAVGNANERLGQRRFSSALSVELTIDRSGGANIESGMKSGMNSKM